ncbi:hypothetical protein SAMN04488023_111113 [Pedobacter rhizosphaerae]|uniref:Uncharacterized protein n=2 Tax=Pedobacter rhizosphaerae TaxID=390241 RepID=A0A1H9QBR7_9SPHI|nr:hypothetical protein SAMN04488023_111113 [Pedobacter rhizosphaerae]
MNQQDIFKKIGHILAELNEQYQFLAQNPQQLNDLEVELFLANANFLSDHVHIVKKLNTQNKEAAVERPAPIAQVPTIAEEILAEKQPTPALVEEQNTLSELEEIATAEEEEERVDIKPEQEVLEEQHIQEETADAVLNKDFFKPDQDDHTFEFVLGTHSENDQFDYEAKPVEEIFDRKLSKEEEEILAQKKKIQEKELLPEAVQYEASVTEDDEIGPEPFLIAQEEDEEPDTVVESRIEEDVEAEKVTVAEPIEALKGVDLDEPVISAPVEERPVFTPQAVPVKPTVAPIETKAIPTLNDLLAKSNSPQETVKAPIADLKQAINLNEKLLFIKDLFNGYNLAYSEAIDIVNKMNSFEAADSFLQSNYAAKNNWANKQSTVDQFYEVLNRRFAK